jgi:outer membrane immunogenic protein
MGRRFHLLTSTALTASAVVASGAALAADLRMPVKAPPVVVPFSWNGCYAGVNFGGLSHRLRHRLDVPAGTDNLAQTFETDGRRDPEFIVGGQIGCNYQFGSNWVVGLEGDINLTDARRDSRFDIFGGGEDTVGSQSTRLRWLSTVRGRLGPTWGRAFLYVTGGLAIGKVESSATAQTFVDVTTTFNGSVSQTRLGGVVGVGIEYAFTDRVSAKMEYLHFALGSADYTVTGALPTTLPPTWNASAKVSGDIFRAGINFKFLP